MDNCSHNGEKLFSAIKAVAARWSQDGTVKPEFLDYLSDESKVSFPWSMIDKITPRPDKAVQSMLNEAGFEDTEIIATRKNTYTAAFVNAEEAEYLVIEDRFPNGRPLLEKGGVIFTDRETVNMTEKMKVCTCLNPLHTALAIFGCLLSYGTIHAEMEDEDLQNLIYKLGFDEGIPVVVDPKIISPASFLREVLEVRLPNPFMPDTPQRIATDTSQKLPIRFGETVKAYLYKEDLDVRSLTVIPLVFAGWCRYLMGVNDNGEPFELSPDPLLDDIRAFVKEIRLGDTGSFHAQLHPILSNEAIFGVNLYDVGLAEKVEQYFAQLVAGEGAVRKVIHAV
jgi:fructuronate reductase